jgi:hypothetical protein
MENNTELSNKRNIVESNKKFVDIAFTLIIILILISTFASARPRNYQYIRVKKNNTITIGLETGISQKSMVYNIDNFNQKYLELGYRLNVSKALTNNINVELAGFLSLDNPAPNTNYTYTDKNRIFSVSTVYKIEVVNNIFLEPKIGIAWFQYRENGSYTESGDYSVLKQTQALQIGARARYQLAKNLSIGGGADYLISEKNLSFPFAYAGLYFNFDHDRSSIGRRCPTKF